MTQEQNDQDFKTRLKQRFGYDDQKVNIIAEIMDKEIKPEDGKEILPLTPKLEEQLRKITGN